MQPGDYIATIIIFMFGCFASMHLLMNNNFFPQKKKKLSCYNCTTSFGTNITVVLQQIKLYFFSPYKCNCSYASNKIVVLLQIQ